MGSSAGLRPFTEPEPEPVVSSPHRLLWYASDETLAAGTYDYQPADAERANLTGSALADGMHLPVLDIDFEAQLVPSTTPGHYHLYLDGMRPLRWEQYKSLLLALADAGVISHGYALHSIAKGMTMVRLPGVQKKTYERASDEMPEPKEPPALKRSPY